MKTFKEYIELKEEENFEDEILNEDPLTMAGIILGYGAAGLLIGFGGALLITGYVKLGSRFVASIKRFYKRFNKKNLEPKAINEKMKDLRVDSKVRLQGSKIKEERSKLDEEMKEVFAAIKDKDPVVTKEKLKNVKKDEKVINRMVIYEATKVYGEPPLHYGSTGNPCYLFVKRVLSIKVARAASIAVTKAFGDVSEDLLKNVEKEGDE